MAITPWQADNDVVNLFNDVKAKHHHPRLEHAKFAICFADSKPFVKGRFNWGKLQKFSPLAKLWHPNNNKYDFQIVLCSTAWSNMLNMTQREALVDLHLTRCDVEYEPETTIDPINNKVIPVKDEWGRPQMSNKVKYDEEGNCKWRIEPLDLYVFSQNVSRYGLWVEEILDFSKAIKSVENKSSS